MIGHVVLFGERLDDERTGAQTGRDGEVVGYQR